LKLKRLLLFMVVATVVPLWVLAQQWIGDTSVSFTLPDTIRTELTTIYQTGQARGNYPDVFVKIGDSITVSHSFLYPFSTRTYQLGEYAYLQPVIDLFSLRPLRTGNSFSNRSLAAGEGWAAWAVLDPSYADPNVCKTRETPLVCEYRVNRPALALIMFGTNDVGYIESTRYERNLREIVALSKEMGVIPILSTIPNRPDVGAKVAEFNTIVAEIAAEANLPLWDYHAALQGLPNDGLTFDRIHPSTPPGGVVNAGNLSAANLQYGYVVRNLTALQMLYTVWQNLPQG
jgi:hypothetical protein